MSPKTLLLLADRVRRTLAGTAVRVLAGLGAIDLYQPVPWLGLAAGKRGAATGARWDAISKELSDTAPSSALDLGCQLGYFSFRLAEAGYLVLGVDGGMGTTKCAELIRTATGLDRAVFVRMALSERSVASLPSADVVLFLSLWHHLCRQSGFAAARRMLQQVLQRTRRVCFFETGQSDEAYLASAGALPDMGEDPRAWLERLLLECGGKRVRHLGAFETHLGPVPRHLFAAYRDP